MESPFLSALIGLAGVAVGGITSFATTWLTQLSAASEKRRLVEIGKREKLFNDFVTEAARLYGDALGHGKDDITDLVKLYALIGRMRLVCSDEVVAAADRAMTTIIQTYLSPNRTLAELRLLAEEGGMNPLLGFDDAGRAELAFLASLPARKLRHSLRRHGAAVRRGARPLPSE